MKRLGATMTNAFDFYSETRDKYFFPHRFPEFKSEHQHELTYGHPNPYAKYEIKFIDGSSTQVIMTTRQRLGVVNGKKWNNVIDKIGGLGYMSKVN